MAEFKEVMRRKEEMCYYYDKCKNCPLDVVDCHSMDSRLLVDIEEIIMNWEKPVDWSNVKIDTKILVRNYTSEPWTKRYFAEYKDGCVYAFCDGATRWNNVGILNWRYAKLAEVNNENQI